MQILIWKNGRWCPFPEEEIRRLRRLAGEGAVISRDPGPTARDPKSPSLTRAARSRRSKRMS